jgi:alpha-L-arabinofuranosidase
MVSVHQTHVYVMVSVHQTHVYVMVSAHQTHVYVMVSAHQTHVYVMVSVRQTHVYVMVSVRQTHVYVMVSVHQTHDQQGCERTVNCKGFKGSGFYVTCGNILEGLGKTMKKIYQDRHCSGLDSNPKPSEYNSELACYSPCLRLFSVRKILI